MNFTPELIGWIAFISVGWLVLGIGFGMFFGRTVKLPHGRERIRLENNSLVNDENNRTISQ